MREGTERLARRLNETRDVALYRRLSRAWTRHVEVCGGLFSRVLANGSRIVNERPADARAHMGFTEDSALAWSFYAPHDLAGLVALFGKAALVRRMDSLLLPGPGARRVVDIVDHTGLIGSLAHGNEFTHHLLFWYALLGHPRRTEAFVASALRMYTPAVDGLPGNDDAGQMSAWYLLVRLGLFPVDPLSPRMLRLRFEDRALSVRSFRVSPMAHSERLRWLIV